MFANLERPSIGTMARRKLKTRSSLSIILVTLIIVLAGQGQSVPISWPMTIASAQSSTATLYGTVQDPEGAVVPDVAITVTNVETSLRREALTDKAGYFAVPLLSPGRYEVTAQRQGFATLQITNVVLRVNDQLALKIELKIGQISESVTIEGASLIQTESAVVSTVVDHQFVENLPLNGRSFGALIELTPGTVLTRASEGQFSVNGQRATTNYFTVDGVSANVGNLDKLVLAGTIPAFNVLGGLNNLVSVDALEEFRVQTSTYAAEFGRMPGAQVSVITRSGTNQFHGDVFDYFRNDALDANDWFANSRGLPKPPLRQNDFGGVVGGPILRNKTFFFFSYEGLRLRQPQFRLTQSPTLAVRNAAPIELKPFLDVFPIPNGKDLGGGFAESFAGYSEPSTLNATSIRIDHRAGSKINLFSRFNYAPSENTQRNLLGVLAPLNQFTTSQQNATTLTLGSTQVISPRISNDFRVNYSRGTGAKFFALDNFAGGVPPTDSVMFPPSTNHRESAFSFQLGFVAYLVGLSDVSSSQRQWNVVDNFLITARSHQLKFGVDYRRLAPIAAVFGENGFAVDVVYADTNAVIANRPAFVDAENVPTRYPLFTNFSAYAQDTWKAMPRLTLAYGLRWEVNTPPTDRHGNDAFTVRGLDDPATMTLAPLGTPLWETTYNNFAPRIGVAYQLSQTRGREMVLRGGFGIFYDLGTGPTFAGIQAFTFPYFRRQTFQTFPFNFNQISIPPINFHPSPPYDSLLVFDPHLKLPRTYEWNVSVEQSFGTNQSLTISYVGAAGRRLLRQEVLRGLGLPNPNFTRVAVSRNAATSDYDALQLQFQRRLSRGLQALASYTWSHSIDIASADSALNLPITKIDPKSDRGASDFDVRHSFSAAATYDIPSLTGNHFAKMLLYGWSVDAIFKARTATPISLVTPRVLFGVPAAGVRPDLVPGVPLYIADPTVAAGKRLNPAAFTVPPIGQQGTLGRNAVRGFPLSQLDFSVRRKFPLGEQFNLQLRADLFNAFNHPNFGAPVGFVGSPLFGQATRMLGSDLSGGVGSLSPLYQVGGPRSVQLALKLQF
ncbi:MAG TPA: carboxypeptidase regulatory-like domain-containing protein [Blastocatellia bacterium]|nr:carboxypeptidase regulatory-like domain-containing protein [Blastocatellia bacterium]